MSETISNRLEISIGQYSAAGVKAENQDFYGAFLATGAMQLFKGITIAIADGISSSRLSRQAAEMAVGSLMTDYYATPDSWSVKSSASRIISATNSWAYSQSLRARLEDMNHGYVTTLSALILKGEEGHIFHVGDSRIQRLVETSLEPLTEDHRMAVSMHESYLARGLGMKPTIEIDYRKVILQPGDTFLLTTDGIHDYIDGAFISKAILSTQNLDEAAQLIAEEALVRGSQDNVTIQLVRIDKLAASSKKFLMTEAELPLLPLPKIGDVIDGFHIVREIYSSARSSVFLATTQDGDRVAFKIPSGEQGRSDEYLQRFRLEEWIMSRLTSIHILKPYPEGHQRSGHYTVSEYIEGQTVRQWMNDHPQPALDEFLSIIGQIIAGLRSFHRQEMLHQDLRPENILIDQEGLVKIIDFGSASIAGMEEAMPGVTGAMAGTFQYTAPEYLSGDVISWRSDQFSLGVIAYEMLTGCLPYGTDVAKISNRKEQKRLIYRPARDDNRSIPVWVDKALRRAVHPDPLLRYEALSDFLTDLKNPGAGWENKQPVPLVQRNPVALWQGISALLALLLLILTLYTQNLS